MKIQLFKTAKGLIHGDDPRRIGCDREGTLKIGSVEVHISEGEEAVMPVLANGAVGVYAATYTTRFETYDLGKVTVRGGKIVPPDPTEVELMELRCRLEYLEAENEDLREQLRKLANIFDTNSLNFLIK
jgi:hypothetical protein